MQTFLPYSSYAESANVLDMRRLGKQRVETLQILNALTDPEYGWQNHPAVNMWRGYEYELIEYGIAICNEWISRGYKDTCLGKIAEKIDSIPEDGVDFPPWIGSMDFHRSHQSNLLRKDPVYYNQFFSDVPADLEYVWP